MNTELFIVSHGVRIAIKTNDTQVLNRLSDYLPPGHEISYHPIVDKLYLLIANKISQECNYQLYRGEQKLLETSELEEALELLDSDLRIQIAISVKNKLFVHSGVVGWQGKAIVIPGRSFTGKTTLVESLVKAGATYYSDEYAVFDSNGLVSPYPRPLSIRQRENQREFRIRRYPVEAFNATVGTEPIPVDLILDTKYNPQQQWNPCKISSGEALLTLLDNTVVARLRPDFALAILAKAVSGSLCLAGERGEANDFATSLLESYDSIRKII